MSRRIPKNTMSRPMPFFSLIQTGQMRLGLQRLLLSTGIAYFHEYTTSPQLAAYKHSISRVLKARLSCRPVLRCIPPVPLHASLWQDVSPEFAGSHLQKKPPDTTVDRSCDEVRRLINKLVDSGEFSISDFCEKIRVSKTSYYRFMRQSGPWKGEKGDTFPSALQYFQQRERDGVKINQKTRNHKTRSRPSASRSGSKADVAISLDGESNDNVPVYDTCDEVRRKITWHMRRPETTQAAFLRDLSSQFQTIPTKIRPSNLEKFRAARGPNVGNTNPVFYAAYVFFEKKRIRAGKEKSKLRETMEKIYGKSGGVNVKSPSDKYGGWVGEQPQGSHARIDKYGLVIIYDMKSNKQIKYIPRGSLLASKSTWAPPEKFYTYD